MYKKSFTTHLPSALLWFHFSQRPKFLGYLDLKISFPNIFAHILFARFCVAFTTQHIMDKPRDIFLLLLPGILKLSFWLGSQLKTYKICYQWTYFGKWGRFLKWQIPNFIKWDQCMLITPEGMTFSQKKLTRNW